MRATRSALLLVLALAGCSSEPLGSIPQPVPLRCGADPLTDGILVAQGQINLRTVGPCGDLVYQSFNAGVSTMNLVSPGRDPSVLVGQPVGFSPSGDRLAMSGATGQVYDTDTGQTHDLFEGFGAIQFLRDDADPPHTFTIGCGEGEVRILDDDGTVRALAEDVVSCPASAPHAPVMLYQDTDGHLHRLDLRDEDDLLLGEILYSDGTTTFPDSGRNDLLQLSSDGEVVVHLQRSWGVNRDWATLTRLTDGEVLGSVSGAQARFDAVAIPGGHVMVMNTGEYLWVLSQDYQFFAYEGLVNQGLLADRQLVTWSETGHELFVFEPVTGLRSPAIFVDEAESTSRPNLQVAPGGAFFAMDFRTACETGSCSKTLLYDVARQHATTLFEGQGDVNTRFVTGAGVALLEGVFRVPDDIVYQRDVRLYAPDGTILGTITGRNLGRVDTVGDTLFLQSYDPTYSASRLDRVDAASGAITAIVESAADFRVAGERIYYQTQADETGSTELHALPIE